MKLTYQEKLAVMMTAAKSSRNLAGALGITHQMLGRWLREGEHKGVKSIPFAAHPIIDAVFDIYRSVAKETAQLFGVPFFAEAPVLMTRRLKRDGTMSDIVVVEHTQFIRRDLRSEFFTQAVHSEKFYTAAVRSTIDLHEYPWRKGKTHDEHGELTRQAERDMLAFLERENLSESSRLHTLFTPYENVSYQVRTRAQSAVRGIEQKLREKHEPATTTPKTALADMYLLQLLPANYKRNDITSTRNERSKRRDRRNIRGAGPK